MPRLHHFPSWKSNPYTTMLMQGVAAAGWEVDGSLTAADVVTELAAMRRGDVFHIQWTQPIVHDMPDEEAARESLTRFRKALTDARRVGVAVLWTIHNLMPHSAKFPLLEIELARFLATEADRIIQLTGHTRDAAAAFYELPRGKMVTLPHASYVGIYGEAPDRATARAELGIPLSSPTVGFIGQIRHYKGVSTLLRAVEQLSREEDDLTLVLAGKTSPTEFEAIEREIPRGVRAVRRHAFVPDEDIATWFTACDVMAFPYRNILNSGSVLLAATYGVPAVIPAEANLVSHYGDQEWLRYYSAHDDEERDLARQLAHLLSTGPRTRASARHFAESYTAWDMASDYLEIVRVVSRAPRGGSIS